MEHLFDFYSISMYNSGITTARLYSRLLNKSDAKIWTDFFEEEDAIKFMPLYSDFGNTSLMSEFWINKQLERYEENRYGLQALIDRKSEAMVGQCGLLSQNVDGINELEVGYHIIPKYWNQGLATEAAQAFKEFAFQNKIADSIISIIDINNMASQKVALKNGMVKEKQTTYYGHDVYIYRIWDK